MEYVTSVITLSVITGVLFVTVSGFRLSSGLKMSASLLMVTATVLLLLGLFENEAFVPDCLFDEAEAYDADSAEIYIEACKKEIEDRLMLLLSNELETEEVSVSITLDSTDVSDVKIAEVTIFTSGEASRVKEIVRENTGCKSVTVKEYKP